MSTFPDRRVVGHQLALRTVAGEADHDEKGIVIASA